MPTYIHVNDAKLAALRAELGVTGGQIDDLEKAWLIQEGATGETTMDLWYDYVSGFVSAGHINDMFYAWLGGLGYTGALSDRWLQYWNALAGGFSPLDLFSGGEEGFWLDPSDLSTMWQDSGATTPAVVGQPVGRINDKSGNGWGWTAGAGARPILQQDGALYYLEFNGAQSMASTGPITMSATDQVMACCGLRKDDDTAQRFAFELSVNSGANNGAFTLQAPNAATPTVTWQSRGTSTAFAISPASFPAPIKLVATGQSEIVTAVATLRLNAVQVANSAASQGTGNYGNYPFYIGSRASAGGFFIGRIYQLVVVGRNVTTQERDDTEAYVNAKTGAY